ncbi:hypothetical protein RRG08_066919 [Elysia crispata]|uniref:Uncharacterized protein n=1 Tax=Elysia crispata TaxID=231223 RepID=A0AAE1AP16_9GAST|nr:hypothetical protein RRG08_066919 [Elysia crispata]
MPYFLDNSRSLDCGVVKPNLASSCQSRSEKMLPPTPTLWNNQQALPHPILPACLGHPEACSVYIVPARSTACGPAQTGGSAQSGLSLDLVTRIQIPRLSSDTASCQVGVQVCRTRLDRANCMGQKEDEAELRGRPTDKRIISEILCFTADIWRRQGSGGVTARFTIITPATQDSSEDFSS